MANLFCRIFQETPSVVMPPSQYEKIALRFFRSRNLPLASYNKTIGGSWYRPDFIFKQNDVAVVVECDEQRHETYDRVKEEIRETVIMNRLRDLGFRPHLVRYDPAPENVRACVRAAEVSDVVYRLLHGMDIKHLTWREHVSVQESGTIIIY